MLNLIPTKIEVQVYCIIKELKLKYKSIELLKCYKWRLRKACWVKLTSFFLQENLIDRRYPNPIEV